MLTTTELCTALCSGEQVKAYQARGALFKQAAEAGASGREADKAALAQELAEFLKSLKPAKDGRGEPTVESMNSVEGAIDVCRALAAVGGDSETTVLAECLKNIDLREPARWCLARMTCPSATDVLAEALKTAAGTEFRVGLINALGQKGGSAAADALKSAVTDNETEVRLAAIEGLAEIPVAEHDAIIAGVETGKSSRAAARVARARIRLAYSLLSAGDKSAAKTIFLAVEGSPSPDAQKKAASLGAARC